MWRVLRSCLWLITNDRIDESCKLHKMDEREWEKKRRRRRSQLKELVGNVHSYFRGSHVIINGGEKHLFFFLMSICFALVSVRIVGIPTASVLDLRSKCLDEKKKKNSTYANALCQISARGHQLAPLTLRQAPPCASRTRAQRSRPTSRQPQTSAGRRMSAAAAAP